MIFKETKIRGAFTIELDRLDDDRGFFARTFCEKEFKNQGLNPKVMQCNVSFNRKKGTLRGMHYQASPHEEAKLIRCTRGALYDVILDIRRDSPTFGDWVATELTLENRKMVYAPEGLAHGFQTLEDDTEVFYQMTEFYHPKCSRGIRWDDPMFDIKWPIDKPTISMRDRQYLDFNLREIR